jgi:hypothetical protein
MHQAVQATISHIKAIGGMETCAVCLPLHHEQRKWTELIRVTVKDKVGAKIPHSTELCNIYVYHTLNCSSRWYDFIKLKQLFTTGHSGMWKTTEAHCHCWQQPSEWRWYNQQEQNMVYWRWESRHLIKSFRTDAEKWTIQWTHDFSFLKGAEKMNEKCARTKNPKNHFF